MRSSALPRLNGMTLRPSRFALAVARVSFVLANSYAATACLPAATEAGGVTPLEGRWDISGTGAGGVTAAFQGSWTVKSVSVSTFSGSVDVLETSSAVGQRRLSGPITGRMASASATEFDLVLGNVSRRHVGTVQGDTVRGNWFDVNGGGSIEASGTFRAVRR